MQNSNGHSHGEYSKPPACLTGVHNDCRFPATFTFVVRSFTVLDGIGKSLDPRFDMTEIAAPYARGLLLEAKPQIARLQKDFAARLGQQVSPFSPQVVW